MPNYITENMKKFLLISLFFFIISFAFAQNQAIEDEKKTPIGVEFKKESLKRIGSSGDNWCITWVKDGSQITSMCDGNWIGLDNPKFIHNHLFRLLGDADSFQREDIPSYPDYSGKEGSWFGYGVVSVDNNIYSVISKTPGKSWSGPFTGIKLLKSPDNGKTWYRIDRIGNELLLEVKDSMRNVVNDSEMFFLKEYGTLHNKQKAYPFSFVSFVQNGQNNSAAKDNYIYIYSPEGAHSNKLTLARAHKKYFSVRSKWQYFTRFDEKSKPSWTKDITKRGYVYEYPDRSKSGHVFGWYSWLPSIVWNKGLGLYIMVNGGTYGGHKMTDSDKDYYDGWMHTETGSLGFWYSKTPFGPWKQFYYSDYWIVDNEANRTYQPKLSPKWISEDGTQMTLIWSDAMKNEKGHSHTVNYLWNQMKITIQLE